jgi:hypothetical protein
MRPGRPSHVQHLLAELAGVAFLDLRSGVPVATTVPPWRVLEARGNLFPSGGIPEESRTPWDE